jgi:hypothetical protein
MSCRQDPDGIKEWCGSVDVPNEWKATLGLLIVGILCLCCTCALLIVSLFKDNVLDKAQNMAFAGSMKCIQFYQRYLKPILNHQKNRFLFSWFCISLYSGFVLLGCTGVSSWILL